MAGASPQRTLFFDIADIVVPGEVVTSKAHQDLEFPPVAFFHWVSAFRRFFSRFGLVSAWLRLFGLGCAHSSALDGCAQCSFPLGRGWLAGSTARVCVHAHPLALTLAVSTCRADPIPRELGGRVPAGLQAGLRQRDLARARLCRAHGQRRRSVSYLQRLF